MNLNIFSDLRKPGLVPGKSLSLSTKIDSVLEKNQTYIRKININDAKPVSAISAADNMLQDFKQSMLRTEHTHPYNLCSSSM